MPDRRRNAASPRHLALKPSRSRHVRPVGALVALVLVLGIGSAVVVSDEDPAGESAGGAPSRATTTTSTADPTSTTATTISPTRGSGQPVTIAFAGDMYVQGSLRARLDADPAGFVGPFSAVLSAADLAVGNLELAVTERGTPTPGKQFTFRGPPGVLDALRAGGFDVVSMANNHGMDFGREGLADSIDAKRASGGFIIGIGAEENEAYAPYSTEVKGQRIAVIAATQVLDDHLIPLWTAGPEQPGLASAKRVERLSAEVAMARSTHDTVVVFLHWGIEQQTCPAQRQMDLAATLRDEGADIIVGGHAHRVQGGGLLDGTVVHYGLGNFVFAGLSAPGSRTGVLLVTVTGREVDGYEWVPGRISNSVPIPLEGAEAAREVAAWDAQRGCTNLAP